MLHSAASIILASTSATRRDICASIGLPVTCMAPSTDEDALKAQLTNHSPAQLAQALAEAKALSISSLHPEAYVIGADQICAKGSRIFGKSGNAETALEHLLALQGSTHYQHSGYAIAHQGRIHASGCVDTRLEMHGWDRNALIRYIEMEKPFASAGSYKFESSGRLLFSHVDGTSDQIMGLPLSPILTALLAANVIAF